MIDSLGFFSDKGNNGINDQNMPNTYNATCENPMDRTSMISKASIIFLGTLIFAGFARAETPQSPPVITADPLAPRYESSLAEGIDFTKAGYPGFLQAVSGVSQYEPWGRWTDGKEAKFRFTQKLPKKFRLELMAQAFGPNVNAPLTVLAGKVKKQMTITDVQPKPYSLSFDNVNSDSIILIPAKPTAPNAIGINQDARLLGIGLVQLKVK